MPPKKKVAKAAKRTIEVLEPKSIFELNGKRHRLQGFDDAGARVTVLTQAEVGAGGGKMKTIEYGVATIYLPVDTEID